MKLWNDLTSKEKIDVSTDAIKSTAVLLTLLFAVWKFFDYLEDRSFEKLKLAHEYRIKYEELEYLSRESYDNFSYVARKYLSDNTKEKYTAQICLARSSAISTRGNENYSVWQLTFSPFWTYMDSVIMTGVSTDIQKQFLCGEQRFIHEALGLGIVKLETEHLNSEVNDWTRYLDFFSDCSHENAETVKRDRAFVRALHEKGELAVSAEVCANSAHLYTYGNELGG